MNNSYITMNQYTTMLLKPLFAMYDNIILIVPTLVGVLVLDTFMLLVAVESKLVLGLLVLMFIDMISGIYKANRERRAIVSTGLRQTSIKLIEYTLVSLAFVVLSNMSDILGFVRSIPFLYLSMIEIKSIIENLSDEKGVLRGLFEFAKERINRTLNG
jgi:phage-related holin